MTKETVEVDLIIEAMDKGFERVLSKMGKVNEAASDPAPSKAATRWTELASKMNAAEQVFQMTTGTIQKTWDILEEGAALDLSRRRFERLTESIGSTSEAMLGDLARASGGMMTQAEMIASASDIISLGLADNQKDVVDLASLVSQLGWDMQQVIMTFANNSKQRLDALGLSVEDVQTRMKELEKQGYDTDRAFDLAVIEAGQAKLELLGSAADTTAGGMARLKVRIMDTKNSLLELIGTRSEGFFSGLANVLDSVEAAERDLKLAFDAGLITRKQYVDGLNDVQLTWMDLRGELANARAELERHNEIMGAVDSKLERYIITQEEAKTAVSAYGRSLEGVRDNYEEIDVKDFTNKLEDQNKALEDGREKLEAYHQEFARNFVSALEGGTALFGEWVTTSTAVGGMTQEQSQNFSDLGSEADKLTREINSLQGGTASLGLTEEEVNKRLEESRDRLAEVQARMAPLAGITTEYTNVQTTWTVNQEAMNEALLDSIIAFEGNAKEIAIAGYALGIYDETQLATALNTAIITEKINRLAESFVSGQITASQLREEMEEISQGSPYTAEIEAITDGAIAKINDINSKLDALASRTTTTRVVVEETRTGGQALPDPSRPTARAFGGPVHAGGFYRVGEMGPELFRPSVPGTIIPMRETAVGTSTGSSMTVYNYNQTREAAAIAYADIERLRRQRMDQT